MKKKKSFAEYKSLAEIYIQLINAKWKYIYSMTVMMITMMMMMMENINLLFSHNFHRNRFMSIRRLVR